MQYIISLCFVNEGNQKCETSRFAFVAIAVSLLFCKRHLTFHTLCFDFHTFTRKGIVLIISMTSFLLFDCPVFILNCTCARACRGAMMLLLDSPYMFTVFHARMCTYISLLYAAFRNLFPEHSQCMRLYEFCLEWTTKSRKENGTMGDVFVKCFSLFIT